MGGRRPEVHITDLWTTRTEVTSRKQRWMEASSKGGQGPRRGCSATHGWMDYSLLKKVYSRSVSIYWNVQILQVNVFSSENVKYVFRYFGCISKILGFIKTLETWQRLWTNIVMWWVCGWEKTGEFNGRAIHNKWSGEIHFWYQLFPPTLSH